MTFPSEAKCVLSGKKNTDIAWLLYWVNGRMSNKLQPINIRAYQGNHTVVSKLRLEARLNCHCAGHAKMAIYELPTHGISSAPRSTACPPHGR